MSDFLIVGAGSAGCVLADRLSAGGAEVTLVEAGRDTPPGAVPADITDLFPRSYYNAEYMWPGLTADVSAGATGVAQPLPAGARDGRRVEPDGHGRAARAPGGLRRLGGRRAGWGWDDVLPYFRRLETDWDFDGALHGSRRADPDPPPPRRGLAAVRPGVAQAAADTAGRSIDDMNGDFSDGFGRCR